MSQLSAAKARMDQADYTLAGLVEIQRGGNLPSTPAEFAAMIRGATVDKVRARMKRLEQMGILEVILDEDGYILQVHGQPVGYQLTIMGETLLSQELVNWEPAPSERSRRETELMVAARTRS